MGSNPTKVKWGGDLWGLPNFLKYGNNPERLSVSAVLPTSGTRTFFKKNYLYNPLALSLLVSDWLTKRGIRLKKKQSAYKRLGSISAGL